jgi:hypothetical protein
MYIGARGIVPRGIVARGKVAGEDEDLEDPEEKSTGSRCLVGSSSNWG